MKFADQIKKSREEMVSEVDEFRQAVTISLFNSVILDTSHDTGRLRGNWQTNEGDAKQGEIDRLDKTGTLAMNEVLQVVSASNPDSSVHLTNNLPYAIPIEMGTKKHPEGMVRKNVARIEQILREKQK